MSQLPINGSNALYFEHQPPTTGCCFVFFNALIGDTTMWEAEIAPALRSEGHGTLLWNYRGQRESPVDPTVTLNAELISNDAASLLEALKPEHPILVGLSIGGLFAARQWLQSGHGQALTLINTLRQPSPRLDWINQASMVAAQVGGLPLLKDLFSPLIFNHDWLAANVDTAFTDTNYQGLTADQGHFRLLNDARQADWQLPYDKLQLPVQVISGLQDNLFYEPDAVDQLASRIPDCERIDIEDAGHMIPVERPQALIGALQAIAQRVLNTG